MTFTYQANIFARHKSFIQVNNRRKLEAKHHQFSSFVLGRRSPMVWNKNGKLLDEKRAVDKSNRPQSKLRTVLFRSII